MEHSELRFAYTQGQVESTPPPEFERSGFLGPPPFYRFVNAPDMFKYLSGSLPAGEEHEDTLRYLQDQVRQVRSPWADVERAVNALLETIEADPDIQVRARVCALIISSSCRLLPGAPDLLL
jgi:hypothetical protein